MPLKANVNGEAHPRIPERRAPTRERTDCGTKASTPLDDFLFDLRGYLILEDAVEPELLDALNAAFDTFPPLEYGQWHGNAQRRDYNGATGYELHNCVEAGEPFRAAYRQSRLDQLSAPLLRRRKVLCPGAFY